MLQAKMKQCPVCKAAAVLNAPACLKCGHWFRTNFADDSRTVAIAGPGPCARCGKTVPPGAAHCPACGTRVGSPNASPSAAAPAAQAVTVHAGDLRSADGAYSISVGVTVDRFSRPTVHLHSEPTDRRRSPHSILLNSEGYARLKQLLEAVDAAIAQSRMGA